VLSFDPRLRQLDGAATSEAAAVGDASVVTASASGAQVAGAGSPAASATVTLRCAALRIPLNGVAGRATCLFERIVGHSYKAPARSRIATRARYGDTGSFEIDFVRISRALGES